MGGADLIPAAQPLERVPAASRSEMADKAQSEAGKPQNGAAASSTKEPAAGAKAAASEANVYPPLKKIPGGLDFVVKHDTESNKIDVCIARGKTVLDLKRAICDRVLRGP